MRPIVPDAAVDALSDDVLMRAVQAKLDKNSCAIEREHRAPSPEKAGRRGGRPDRAGWRPLPGRRPGVTRR
ncbi:MAG: hypothetical protein OXH75_19375 [Acidobacteria bacterium]|nr:hypothetical protein [Acidobacteriota bacterium]